jgi:hypothetical protein
MLAIFPSVAGLIMTQQKLMQSRTMHTQYGCHFFNCALNPSEITKQSQSLAIRLEYRRPATGIFLALRQVFTGCRQTNLTILTNTAHQAFFLLT